MIDYCYHTHPYRCGHAVGREEDYVKAAIDAGYKVVGFTDHVFLPGLEQPGMRGSYMELDDYIYTINNLKKKYKDKIEIHLGFECEYDEELEDYYHYLLDVKGIEYLILGQHLFYDSGNLTWLGRAGAPEEMIERYTAMVIKGMKSGLFKVLAHPDLCLMFFTKITPYVESYLKKICEAAEYYNIPMEFNLGGIRNFRNDTSGRIGYPCEKFFEIASHYNCKIIIGLDTHNPADFSSSDEDIAYAEEIIKRYRLRYIERLYL